MTDLIQSVRFTRPTVAGQIKGPDNRLLITREVRGLALIYWPPEQVNNAVAIAQCESGFETGAWAIELEDSRGLWQLNLDAHPAWALWNLFDPLNNAYFAHQLWSQQGWSPWSCAKVLGIV